MSAGAIKAGAAYVELAIRDKFTQGLKSAAAKLSIFGNAVKSLNVSDALKGVGSSLTTIGASMAAAGGGIVAVLTKSVGLFMDISKFAKETGQSIKGIDPSKADKLSASWNTLKATLGAIQFLVGSALAEPLTKLLNVFISAAVSVARFVKENQALVVQIAIIGAGLLVAGTAITALGVAFGIAGTAVAGMVAGITALMTPVGMVVGLIVGLAAAVLGGVVAWFAFTDAGNNAVAGIAAALSQGDLSGAMSIVLQSLSTMWAQWSDFAVKCVAGAAKAAIGLWESAVKSIAKLMNDSGMFEIHVEEEKAKKLRESQIITNINNMRSMQDQVDEARAAGRTTVQSGSVQVPIEQAEKTIAEMERQNKILIGQHARGESAGTMEGAHDSIDQQVAGWTAPIKGFLDEMKATATAARTDAENQLNEMSNKQRASLTAKMPGIENFAGMVGTPSGLGSSAGAFGGAAGALLGVGSGGGMKVADDKMHELQRQTIKVLNNLEVGATFS